MERHVKRIHLLLFAVLVSLHAAFGQTPVNYEIKARLDPAAKTVIGEEKLVWLNTSSSAVSKIPFHLYLNAFRNNRSTFMKESGGMARMERAAEEWGFCRMKSIRLENGEDLTPSLRYLQPDDNNTDDGTVAEVSLARPVKPGESATFLIEFESKLPRVVSRAGFYRDFYMIAQWFPKVGVLLENGWNCHQYHAESEFFADFGSYHVEITAPAGFVVGATGRRVAERINGDGSITYVHEQDDIHDFAWTACPDFIEFREKFLLDEPHVETEMILLIHKEHRKFLGRHLRALRHALEFYSRSYGPYPYPTITLVDPAPGAQAAGGMEYPTLFTTMSMSWIPSWLLLPELVTIHEFGHNYWYGMIGSNEFEEAWLDEGINTYSQIKALEAFPVGRGAVLRLPGFRASDLDLEQLPVFLSGKFDPIVRRSWEFISGGSYGLNVYYKAGLTMLMLERMLGGETMDRVMKTYFDRWRFRHPTTSDFIRTAEEVSGRDLGWFFSQFLFSPDTLDYAVSGLRSDPVAEFQGWDGQGRFTSSGGEKENRSPGMYRNEMVVLRLGEHVWPQEIEVVFDNGRKIIERWDGRVRWKRFVWTTPDRVVSARLDPREVMVLDKNKSNNSRTRIPHRLLPRKVGLRLMGMVQRLLALLAL